ncbi:MAG: FHA domain-containing protein [Archangiaceae bacterium]|nr:FHA domain-containing protein [Archangiaceae bacterium]
MPTARDVASFGVRFLRDEPHFRSVVTRPVLVWDAPPATKEEPQLFSTRPGEGGSLRPAPGKPVFFDLKKSAKNAFVDEITLGRTTKNDVQVDDNSVSRFHAYFAPGADGVWSLVDSKSTSGTWVNGKKLKAQVAVQLVDRALLKFGEVELLFYEPASFWAYLKRLIGQT